MDVRDIATKHTDSICCVIASDSNTESSSLVISGGDDGLICFHDLTNLQHIGQIKSPDGDAVTSLALHPTDKHTLYAASGQAILALDLRKGFREDSIVSLYTINQEEINSIDINAAGTWLAAGDDSGEIQLLNLAASQTTLKPSCRTLRRGHSNICSSVAFVPNRTSDVITGGLDCSLLRWDYTRIRLAEVYNLTSEQAAANTTGQAINPPMVHCIALSNTCTKSKQPSILAAARGDGCIGIYNPSLQTPPSKSSGKKSANSRSNTSAAAAENSSQQTMAPLVNLLQPHLGGHTAACNCVCFLNDDSKMLASVGNDKRLLIWDWATATADQKPVKEHQHSSKINWACDVGRGGKECSVVLGDVDGKLTLVSSAV